MAMISDLHEVNSLFYDGIEYRCGLLLTKERNFFRIKNIIFNGKNTFIFACETYEVESFDSFSNSFKIVPDPHSTDIIILPLDSLENRNSYEIVCYKKLMFIKAETLNLSVDKLLIK